MHMTRHSYILYGATSRLLVSEVNHKISNNNFNPQKVERSPKKFGRIKTALTSSLLSKNLNIIPTQFQV